MKKLEKTEGSGNDILDAAGVLLRRSIYNDVPSDVFVMVDEIFTMLVEEEFVRPEVKSEKNRWKFWKD